jgi:hypothetical protein
MTGFILIGGKIIYMKTQKHKEDLMLIIRGYIPTGMISHNALLELWRFLREVMSFLSVKME